MDGQAAVRIELRDVTSHGGDEAAGFGIDVAPGIPVVETDGDPLRDLELPEPVRIAGEAAASLVGSARSAISWLAAELGGNRTPPGPRSGG